MVHASGNVPVYAFVGRTDDDPADLLGLGLAGVYRVRDLAASDADSMAHADRWLTRLAQDFCEAWETRLRRVERDT